MSHELKAKRILVTGGAGFIGSHIVDKLVDLGADVVVLDNLSSGNLNNLKQLQKKIKFIKGDIRHEKSLEDSMDGVELVCHQAALKSVPKSISRPWEFNDVNVNGAVKLFLKAKEKGIKRIVCASSSSVYGNKDKFPVREDEVVKPISPYAVTKLIVEHYAYVFSKLYDMEIINLRYFNVYGPRQSIDDEYAVVVPKFISCLCERKSPPIYGDGDQERDFTFVSNVVDANVECLRRECISGEVFNIGLGFPSSVNQLFGDLKKIIRVDVEAIYCSERVGDVRKSHASIEKAKRLLGWKPKIDFYQGLEKTVKWFREQRTEDREQRTENRGQRTEDRRQRTEVRCQKTEDFDF